MKEKILLIPIQDLLPFNFHEAVPSFLTDVENKWDSTGSILVLQIP